MNKWVLIFSILMLPLISQGQISQENVTRIVKTLSADDMQGRQAFSPEIWEAAEFIAGEFSAIGLQPLEGEEDYLQRFTLYSSSLSNSSISIDGKQVSSEKYFAIVNHNNVDWTENDDITIKQIQPDDNFRAKLQEYNSLQNDFVVFVDPEHSATFQQFKPYFSRPSRSFAGKTAYNKVFILAEQPASFEIQLNKNVEEEELANVAGMIEGKQKDEIVLFAGHYDHLGVIKPVEGDSIANGANDNASGTTAVIELAHHFAQQNQPERTLMFVGFTAEEVGGFGSQYFSKRLNPDNIVAMFNIEMIGKPATDGPNSAWITGFNRSSFGKLLQQSTKGTKYTFYPDPYPKQNLFYRSDNATLARLGVPAHSISTTPIDVDPDYHQVTDEVSTINLSHLKNTIEAIARAAEGIVSGEDTPTRVDKNSVK